MPYDPSLKEYRDRYFAEPSRYFFEFFTVRLIDGYVGQVYFGGNIVHQTQLFEGGDEANPPARAALEQAQKDLIEKVKGLFG